MTKYLLSFSGGKDSTASWLYLSRELGLDVEPVFADTGWEAPLLHDYLRYLEGALGPITRVHGTMRQLRADLPDEPLTMEKLAAHKGRFASTAARFCTTELKLKPLREHLRRSIAASPERTFVLVSGVRREESPKRARIAVDRASDEFMSEGLDRPIDLWMPLLDWTVGEVFEAHRRHRIAPNPLYLEGQTRVGCWPCFMADKRSLRAMAERHPESFDALAAAEERVGATFFPPDTATPRYRTTRIEGCDKPLPGADDVRRWALGEMPANNLFEPAGAKLETIPPFRDEGEDAVGPACLSPYGLCE